MTGKNIAGILAAVAMVLLIGTPAKAQLPKKGTYKGTFAFSATGKVFEMDAGRVVFAGEFSGPFTNATGKGFMHATSWVCPGVTQTLNDVSQASNGYCVVTDMDGDKAFLTWTGKKGSEKGRNAGTFVWNGGTGKYSGLTGEDSYSVVNILPTQQGYVEIEGAWQLP